MRLLIPLLTFALLSTLTGFHMWSNVAISIWVYLATDLVLSLNHRIAFREYILAMYGLNYLFSAAITYELTQEISFYKMQLTPDEYFSLTIPAILFLRVGLYTLRTKIFSNNFQVSRTQYLLNESLLKQWLFAGVLLTFVGAFVPGELGFVVGLLSSIKYVAVFGLFMINRVKYKWYLYGVLIIEVAHALTMGMFHDMVIWMLFFAMIWTYLRKPGAMAKFALIVAAILALYVLQIIKGSYREQIRAGQSGVGTFSEVVAKNTGAGLFDPAKLAITVSRANQGWILASTIKQMKYVQNYQGLDLLKTYAEAAILPRVLAANKLNAGDRTLFNKFSGHKVGAGTSMALGLFADGYISYGVIGTWAAAFLFGLMCGGIFKVVEKWSRISPYFVVFSFILLNLAVRPDCETQTWLGNVVKGLLMFGVLLYFTKRYFRKSEEPSVQISEDMPGQTDSPIPSIMLQH